MSKKPILLPKYRGPPRYLTNSECRDLWASTALLKRARELISVTFPGKPEQPAERHVAALNAALSRMNEAKDKIERVRN